ncbi:MAG: hypothetical protein QOK44_3733 [Betaproteobacteria bacterium]|jgi:hypothetical protein|nr:hypothetical protein [Betaproteobacteria bacterium]
MTLTRFASLLIVGVLATAAHGADQRYPAKPIRLMIGSPHAAGVPHHYEDGSGEIHAGGEGDWRTPGLK